LLLPVAALPCSALTARRTPAAAMFSKQGQEVNKA
jgi:hypothetical protein